MFGCRSGLGVILVLAQALGGIVFSDPAKLDQLNGIVWPAILKQVDEDVAAAVALGHTTIVVEAAVLLQAGWHSRCHQVWVVTADENVARTRLMNRNGFDEAEANKRIRSQVLDTPADAVIVSNNSGLAELGTAVRVAFREHLSRAADGGDERIMLVDANNNVKGQVWRSAMVRPSRVLPVPVSHSVRRSSVRENCGTVRRTLW